MKNIKSLMTVFCFVVTGALAFGQFTGWTGKYQMTIDPNTPRSFLLEIVPIESGVHYLGDGSSFEIVLDKTLDQSKFVFTSLGNNNTTGIWDAELLSDGTLFSEDECGAFWNITITQGTNYNTPITATAGVPIPFMRVTYNGPEECFLGSGARFYESIQGYYEDDICYWYALPQSGLSNSLQVGPDSDALKAVINDHNNPLVCKTCFRPGTFEQGNGLATNVGISSLRQNNSDGWPQVREGAWIALESQTKGFVPNRLTTVQISAIPASDLVEGMMVYNITEDCLQVNTDGTAGGWTCMNEQYCD